MGVLRSLLLFMMLVSVSLYAAETADTPAQLKKQIEAVNQESDALEKKNAELRKQIQELEQKTKELGPQAMAPETASTQAQAPAKPVIPTKPVHRAPKPQPPEKSLLDTLLEDPLSLLDDPLMLGGAAGVIILLIALVVVMRRRK